jgi:hypothetical protein
LTACVPSSASATRTTLTKGHDLSVKIAINFWLHFICNQPHDGHKCGL